MAELEIDGTINLSETELTSEEFQRKFLEFCEELNVTFGGVFYELDEEGKIK